MVIHGSSQNVLDGPVQSPLTPAEIEGPETGIALCLSGGGYRAMMFHLGSILRLNEAGVLGRVARISSVSGGSIIAGLLGLRWDALGFVDGIAPAALVTQLIADPISN